LDRVRILARMSYAPIFGDGHDRGLRCQPLRQLAPFLLEGRLSIGGAGKGAATQVPPASLPFGLLALDLALEGHASTPFALGGAHPQPALRPLRQLDSLSPPKELRNVALLPSSRLFTHRGLRLA